MTGLVVGLVVGFVVGWVLGFVVGFVACAGFEGSVGGTVGSVTGSVGTVVGSVASVVGSVASVVGSVATVVGSVASVVGSVDGASVTSSVTCVVGSVCCSGASEQPWLISIRPISTSANRLRFIASSPLKMTVFIIRENSPKVKPKFDKKSLSRPFGLLRDSVYARKRGSQVRLTPSRLKVFSSTGDKITEE